MNFGHLTQLFATIGTAAAPGAGQLAGLLGRLVPSSEATAADVSQQEGGFAAILASLTNATANPAAGLAANPTAPVTSPHGNIILPQSPAQLDGKALSTALDRLTLQVGAQTEDGAPDLARLATMLGVTPEQLDSFKADLEAGKITLAGAPHGTSETKTNKSLAAEIPTGETPAQDIPGEHEPDGEATAALTAVLTPYLMVMAALPAAAEHVTPAAIPDLAAAITTARGTAPAVPASAEDPTAAEAAAMGSEAGSGPGKAASGDMATKPAMTGMQLAAALVDATLATPPGAANPLEATPKGAAKNDAKAPAAPLAGEPQAAPSQSAAAMAAQTVVRANAAAERELDARAARKANISEMGALTGNGKTTDSVAAPKPTEAGATAGKSAADGAAIAAAATDKRVPSAPAPDLAYGLNGAFETPAGVSEATDDGGLGGIGNLGGASPLALSTGTGLARAAMAAPNWAPFGAYVAGQVAMQISHAAKTGLDNFKIRLDPPELGRVDVKLEISHDGRINAVLAADNEKTLHLLQKEQGALERALQDAGLKTDSGSLNFSLNSQQHNARDGKDGPLFTGGSKIRAGGDGIDKMAPPTAVLHLTLSDRALDIQV